MSPDSRQIGATLVEVLIALVILSVGIVAVSNMFTESIATLGNLVAQQRAVRLASNVSELLAGLPSELVRDPPTPEEGDCDSRHICTPTHWLAINLQRWQQLAQQQLPNGYVELIPSSEYATSHIDIRITWSHRNGQTLTYALQQEAV